MFEKDVVRTLIKVLGKTLGRVGLYQYTRVGLWAVSRVESLARARAAHLPGFILMVGFSGAFLVVGHEGVIDSSCGNYGSFLACRWPFAGCGGGGALVGRLWAASRVESSACAPRPPWFILLVSFSDILLVVSILDIVCDCHL